MAAGSERGLNSTLEHRGMSSFLCVEVLTHPSNNLLVNVVISREVDWTNAYLKVILGWKCFVVRIQKNTIYFSSILDNDL